MLYHFHPKWRQLRALVESTRSEMLLSLLSNRGAWPVITQGSHWQFFLWP